MGLDVTNTDTTKVRSVCQINHRGEPQAACSHLTWKLPARWHLVRLRCKRLNPCRVVRNYFDLESKIDFVVYTAQTLALIFVNSCICMYLCACSVPVKLLSPCYGHQTFTIASILSPPLFFLLPIPFRLLFPINKACAACTLFHSLPSRWIGDNLHCALFSP